MTFISHRPRLDQDNWCVHNKLTVEALVIQQPLSRLKARDFLSSERWSFEGEGTEWWANLAFISGHYHSGHRTLQVNKLAPLLEGTFTMLPLRVKKATKAVISAFKSSRRSREKLRGTLDLLCDECYLMTPWQRIKWLYLDYVWHVESIIRVGDRSSCWFLLSLTLALLCLSSQTQITLFTKRGRWIMLNVSSYYKILWLY